MSGCGVGFGCTQDTVPASARPCHTTHADGSVGIQISQPIGKLVVHRGIETFGGTGAVADAPRQLSLWGVVRDAGRQILDQRQHRLVDAFEIM